MAAFNWVIADVSCPVCENVARLRCQTHVASNYGVDSGGRFHDREYALGQAMEWWPREHKRFETWRGGRWRAGGIHTEFDEEACYTTCNNCNAPLYVVILYHMNVPERVVAVGKEEDWPEYLK